MLFVYKKKCKIDFFFYRLRTHRTTIGGGGATFVFFPSIIVGQQQPPPQLISYPPYVSYVWIRVASVRRKLYRQLHGEVHVGLAYRSGTEKDVYTRLHNFLFYFFVCFYNFYLEIVFFAAVCIIKTVIVVHIKYYRRHFSNDALLNRINYWYTMFTIENSANKIRHSSEALQMKVTGAPLLGLIITIFY